MDQTPLADYERVVAMSNSMTILRTQYRQLLLLLIKAESDMENVDKFLKTIEPQTKMRMEDVQHIYDTSRHTIIKGNYLYIAMRNLHIAGQQAELHRDMLRCGPIENMDISQELDLDPSVQVNYGSQEAIEEFLQELTQL
jgi:hypothetical protein